MISQEDKNLLIQEISSRLPYGVRVNATVVSEQYYDNMRGDFDILGIDIYFARLMARQTAYIYIGIDDIKLYLRPLSSMTDEEQKEYDAICFDYEHKNYNPVKCVQWLNEHHFDYNNLIEKGLAIEYE